MRRILNRFSNKGFGNILEIIPVAAFLIFTVFFVLYIYFGSTKVYTLDDGDYLFGLQNTSTPENIRIEDPIWGIASIADKEIVNRFYEYITTLQPSGKEGGFSKSGEILYGSIYMSDGQLINFEIGGGIRVDGVEYGSGESSAELAAYMSLLKNNLYTSRNLSNIIKAQSKVRVKERIPDGSGFRERKLGMEQKNLLRKVLLSAKPPAYFEAGWQSVIHKGKVTAGIEVYVDENSKSPEVYIVNYENGLCMVFDSYGNQSGSIMQVIADVSGLNSLFTGKENGEVNVNNDLYTPDIKRVVKEDKVAEEKESIFVLGSYHEDMIKALSEEFEKKTGCKVRYVRMSTGEAQKRLLAGKGNEKYDVWIGGTVDAHEQLKADGILGKYISENEKNIKADYRDKDGVWKAQYMEVLSIGINKEKWNKEFAGKNIPYPNTLKDLLNPAFKGEIVMPNPNLSGTGYIFLASVIEAMGEEKGREYLKALNAQVGQYTESGFSAAEKTGLGEYLICIDFLSDQSLVSSFGYSIESNVYERAGWTLVPVSLIKSEQTKPYAKEFIDFCLTKEAEEILIGLGNVIPTGNYPFKENADKAMSANSDNENIVKYNKEFSPWKSGEKRERIMNYFNKEVLKSPKK